jgi:thiol-disulfide isomerase/thioredoxin
MSMTRRAALLGAAAIAAASDACAGLPAGSSHPGFRAWTAARSGGGIPLAAQVEISSGDVSLRQFLGERPAVLALWASWCAPCLIEKPHQAALAQRLAQAGASARVFAMQAYDDAAVTFSDARWMLDRIGANALPLARATSSAEGAFSRLLNGASPTTTRLPAVLLISADGLELGRAFGAMSGADGQGDYWRDEATFDFLSRLI